MRKILFFIGPIILLIIWWFLDVFEVIDRLYLPSLSEVSMSFMAIISSDGYLHIWATTYRAILGFVIAGVAAIPMGVLLGINKKIYQASEFIIDFFRSLPAPALFPLFLLFFGIGDNAKIAVVVFLAFWIILINTIYGVWNSSKLRQQVGLVFRASRFQIIKEIILPDALPQIFVGLRIALSLSLIMIVVTEMFIGTRIGLGQRIFDSYASYRIPELYSFILIVGLLGYIFNKVFIFFERRIIHWTEKY